MEVSNLLHKSNIHFLALQETWIDSSVVPKPLAGYTWFASGCGLGPGRGGIAFLVHDSLATHCTYSSPYSHNRLGLLLYRDTHATFALINIYNHTSDKLLEQQSLLADLAALLVDLKCPFFIMGDFNSWVGRAFGGGVDKSNPSGDLLVDFCHTWSLTLVNVTSGLAVPTFRRARTIVDYLAVPTDVHYCNVNTIDVLASDHRMVCCEVELKLSPSSVEKSPVWHFSDDPDLIDAFRSHSSLFSERLLPVIFRAYQLLSPTDAILFHATLSNVVIHQASLMVWKFHSQLRRHRPWWTPALTSAFKAMRELYFADEGDRSMFLIARESYRKLVRLAKKDHSSTFYSNLEHASFTNLPSFWRFVRKHRRMGSAVPAIMQQADGSKYASPLDSLEGWRSHFENTFHEDIADPQFSQHEAGIVSDEVNSFLSNSSPSSSPLLDVPFALDELLNALKLLHRTPAGLDGLEYLPIVSADVSFHASFLMLLNKCMDHSIIPFNWNIDILFPLFKKGNPLIFDNYRGISMQPLFTAHVFGNDLLDPNQGGFRSGYRCADHIFVLKEVMWLHTLMRRPLFICLFDVRKAFDRVWRNGLLKLLFKKGVRGRLLKLH